MHTKKDFDDARAALAKLPPDLAATIIQEALLIQQQREQRVEDAFDVLKMEARKLTPEFYARMLQEIEDFKAFNPNKSKFQEIFEIRLNDLENMSAGLYSTKEKAVKQLEKLKFNQSMGEYNNASVTNRFIDCYLDEDN